MYSNLMRIYFSSNTCRHVFIRCNSYVSFFLHSVFVSLIVLFSCWLPWWQKKILTRLFLFNWLSTESFWREKIIKSSIYMYIYSVVVQFITSVVQRLYGTEHRAARMRMQISSAHTYNEHWDTAAIFPSD